MAQMGAPVAQVCNLCPVSRLGVFAPLSGKRRQHRPGRRGTSPNGVASKTKASDRQSLLGLSSCRRGTTCRAPTTAKRSVNRLSNTDYHGNPRQELNATALETSPRATVGTRSEDVSVAAMCPVAQSLRQACIEPAEVLRTGLQPAPYRGGVGKARRYEYSLRRSCSASSRQTIQAGVGIGKHSGGISPRP